MGELRQGRAACMKEARFCGVGSGRRQVVNDVVLSSGKTRGCREYVACMSNRNRRHTANQTEIITDVADWTALWCPEIREVSQRPFPDRAVSRPSLDSDAKGPVKNSDPRHPAGQIPEEPTEAHQPRRDFNRAVQHIIYTKKATLSEKTEAKAAGLSTQKTRILGKACFGLTGRRHFSSSAQQVE